MKQWVILISAVFILIFAGMFEICYLKKTSENMLSYINISKQLISTEDIDGAKENFKGLKNTWENLKQTWGIFIDHEEIGKLDETLLAYNSYLDKGNLEEAYILIFELERLINHIVEKQKIEVGNIL